ncbi:hypothetical protein P7K49_012576 [Saguinus oedipus]|uniref:Peptidase M14 domain-containing protein n=1 Tax=Saguinus oedipus TaxID=9490 RepID=A0ABQ9VTW4_SAGOE|nr:hypothetical protein P7K49_012576 [Saguinus oedipus]
MWEGPPSLGNYLTLCLSPSVLLADVEDLIQQQISNDTVSPRASSSYCEQYHSLNEQDCMSKVEAGRLHRWDLQTLSSIPQQDCTSKLEAGRQAPPVGSAKYSHCCDDSNTTGLPPERGPESNYLLRGEVGLTVFPPDGPIFACHRSANLTALAEVFELITERHPDMLKKVHIGSSYEKHPLYVLKWINTEESDEGVSAPAVSPHLPGKAAVQLTPIYPEMKHEDTAQSIRSLVSGKEQTAKNAIWIDCGIHAREWISPAFCLWFIDHITRFYGTVSEYTSLLRHVDFYVMPVVNVDGYDYTWKKNRMWRKNRSSYANNRCIGTDLNRNFASKHWCAYESWMEGPSLRITDGGTWPTNHGWRDPAYESWMEGPGHGWRNPAYESWMEGPSLRITDGGTRPTNHGWRNPAYESWMEGPSLRIMDGGTQSWMEEPSLRIMDGGTQPTNHGWRDPAYESWMEGPGHGWRNPAYESWMEEPSLRIMDGGTQSTNHGWRDPAYESRMEGPGLRITDGGTRPTNHGWRDPAYESWMEGPSHGWRNPAYESWMEGPSLRIMDGGTRPTNHGWRDPAYESRMEGPGL